MDFGIVGVIDIVIIVLMLICVILGIKVGFMKKSINKFGLLVTFILAIFFAGTVAQLFKSWGIFYGHWYNGFYTKIVAVTEYSSAIDRVSKAEIGLPNFISAIFIKANHIEDGALAPELFSDAIVLMELRVVAFLIIFGFGFIARIILKIFAKGLRKFTLIKVIDSLLGIVLYLALMVLALSSIFSIMHIVITNNPDTSFAQFVITDLQLNTEKFRLGKIIYEGNILTRIVDLFC